MRVIYIVGMQWIICLVIFCAACVTDSELTPAKCELSPIEDKSSVTSGSSGSGDFSSSASNSTPPAGEDPECQAADSWPWKCHWDSDGVVRQTWQWGGGGSVDSTQSAEKRCEFETGRDCYGCTPQTGGASEPRSCYCSGECEPILHIVSAKWEGQAWSPVVGQYNCTLMLQTRCESYLPGERLARVFFEENCFE